MQGSEELVKLEAGNGRYSRYFNDDNKHGEVLGFTIYSLTAVLDCQTEFIGHDSRVSEDQ